MIRGCLEQPRVVPLIRSVLEKEISSMEDSEGKIPAGKQIKAAFIEKFMDSLNDMSKCVKGEFVSTAPAISSSGGKKKRKKRKPSNYQIFIKECMNRPENKNQYAGKPFGAAGEIMSQCAAEWKKKKNV